MIIYYYKLCYANAAEVCSPQHQFYANLFPVGVVLWNDDALHDLNNAPGTPNTLTPPPRQSHQLVFS